MATSITYLFFVIIITFSIVINGENSPWYSQTKPPPTMEQKMTHLHFYFHDTRSGKNPSAIQIAGPANFGALVVADDPLTEGPNISSKLVGRAQGFYITADQSELSLVMGFSFAFLDGRFNGSTLSVLTRNPITHPGRESSVVGGTGVFQFASGYAKLNTVWFNGTTNDAVVEYHVTVIHY